LAFQIKCFIKGDENYYQTRVSLAEAYIGTLTESFYYHPSRMKQAIRFLSKSSFIEVYSPWKDYYRARNNTYTCLF